MNRLELLAALKAVIPGVAKGETLLAGADSFVFAPGLIQSYNDTLSVTFPLDTGVEGTVKAAEIVKVLEKMSGTDVKLEVVESFMEITDGVTALSMRLIEAATPDLIAGLVFEDLDWQALPGDFVQALILCLPSVSRNVIHGAMTGIRVENTDVLSSDNFRATWVVLKEGMTPFTIPGTAVADLLKIPGLEQYATTDAWAHFMSGDGAVFSSRLIASEFPGEALKKMFPEVGEDSYNLPDGLKGALERAGVLAYTQDDGVDFITLSANEDFLTIKGERQYGSIKEKIKIKDGEWPNGMMVNIRPEYMLDIMAKTRRFQMVGNLVYFHGGGFKHIIATIIKN